jgi:hypothetical protein
MPKKKRGRPPAREPLRNTHYPSFRLTDAQTDELWRRALAARCSRNEIVRRAVLAFMAMPEGAN